MARRPASARPSVSSSANSRSPPIGRPDAIRVTASPGMSRSIRTRYVAVASPSVFGSVAMMISVMSTPSTRSPILVSSSRIRSCSGPTPDSGSSAPPNTWYRPRNSRVRSTACTSFGSSTTHTTDPSRRASEQIRQRSSSETLPHTAQNFTPSRTLPNTAVNLSMSGGSTDSRWNAIRCALFGPIPGSLPSSSIRSWTGPSNKSDSWQSQVAHPAGQRAEPVVREDGDLLGRVPDRADDQVLEGFDVTRVDDLRVDPDRDHLAAALHRDLHQAAAGLSVDLGRGQRRLRLHQLLLHLLGLSEECRHIGLATTGLHDDPLAYWSRLGFCRPHAAV